MSGGHFDYIDYHLEHIADKLERLIQTNQSEELNHWGDRIGRNYSEETIAELRNGLEHLRKAAIYIHRIDWLVSGDDGEESFRERLQNDLKGLTDGGKDSIL